MLKLPPPDKDSPGYRAGQLLTVIVCICLGALAVTGTYNIIESWTN